MKDSDNKNWLSSKEAMKEAKLQACDLMHYRTAGKLKYEKRGNTFYYKKDDVIKIKKDNS